VNRDKDLVGLVSLADLTLKGDDDSVTTSTFEDVSAPSASSNHTADEKKERS